MQTLQQCANQSFYMVTVLAHSVLALNAKQFEFLCLYMYAKKFAMYSKAEASHFICDVFCDMSG